tara:strand:- start:671 stop:772 length:102 start_codon:yes stop_codon:yes gene_type:complete
MSWARKTPILANFARLNPGQRKRQQILLMPGQI